MSIIFDCILIGVCSGFIAVVLMWLLKNRQEDKMRDLDYKPVIFKKPNGTRLEGFVIDSNLNLYLIKYRRFGIITRKKWVDADDLIRIDGTYVGPKF